MPVDALPGFRRRFAIVPAAGAVTVALEDDFHQMLVTLHHDGARILAVEAGMPRNPWTTCLGAPAVVKATFAGALLADAAGLGDKRANCTHLYDMAVLAAAHAGDAEPTIYDVLVSDPAGGAVTCELRRNGEAVLHWPLQDGLITGSEPPAGRSLFQLRDWIAGLTGEAKEAAKILQWASIMAGGRTMPVAERCDAVRLPPNCYTLQPENAASAVRTGREYDFSTSGRRLLADFPVVLA